MEWWSEGQQTDADIFEALVELVGSANPELDVDVMRPRAPTHYRTSSAPSVSAGSFAFTSPHRHVAPAPAPGEGAMAFAAHGPTAPLDMSFSNQLSADREWSLSLGAPAPYWGAPTAVNPCSDSVGPVAFNVAPQTAAGGLSPTESTSQPEGGERPHWLQAQASRAAPVALPAARPAAPATAYSAWSSWDASANANVNANANAAADSSPQDLQPQARPHSTDGYKPNLSALSFSRRSLPPAFWADQDAPSFSRSLPQPAAVYPPSHSQAGQLADAHTWSPEPTYSGLAGPPTNGWAANAAPAGILANAASTPGIPGAAPTSPADSSVRGVAPGCDAPFALGPGDWWLPGDNPPPEAANPAAILNAAAAAAAAAAAVACQARPPSPQPIPYDPRTAGLDGAGAWPTSPRVLPPRGLSGLHSAPVMLQESGWAWPAGHAPLPQDASGLTYNRPGAVAPRPAEHKRSGVWAGQAGSTGALPCGSTPAAWSSRNSVAGSPDVSGAGAHMLQAASSEEIGQGASATGLAVPKDHRPDEDLGAIAAKLQRRRGRVPKAVEQLGPIADLARSALAGDLQLGTEDMEQLMGKVRATMQETAAQQKDAYRARNRLAQQRTRSRQRDAIAALEATVAQQADIILQLQKTIAEQRLGSPRRRRLSDIVVPSGTL